MSAITACRTAALGGHVARCDDCGHVEIAYNSCRNRHCPKCQGAAARQWLAERQAELLPVAYYHVVFTLPAPIAAMAFQNKAAIYDLLFKAAAETLTTIAADPKHLGARIGVTAVLHTWGSAMTHHPHIHMIVPGGGLSPDGIRWIACKPGFFLPVRVLSRLFRRLFLEGLAALHRAGRLAFFGDLAALAGTKAFAGRARPVAPKRMGRLRQAPLRRAGSRARLSLALHPSRGDLQQPSPRLRRRQSHLSLERLSRPGQTSGRRWIKSMTLPADEFIRRFLIHVLPSGFHRIRHYGLFASQKRAANIARLRELIPLPRTPRNLRSISARRPWSCNDSNRSFRRRCAAKSLPLLRWTHARHRDFRAWRDAARLQNRLRRIRYIMTITQARTHAADFASPPTGAGQDGLVASASRTPKTADLADPAPPTAPLSAVKTRRRASDRPFPASTPPSKPDASSNPHRSPAEPSSLNVPRFPPLEAFGRRPRRDPAIRVGAGDRNPCHTSTGSSRNRNVR